MRTRRNRALRVAAVATLAGIAVAGPSQGQMIQNDEIAMFARAGKLALERDPLLRYDPYTLLVRFHDGVTEEEKAVVRRMVGGERITAYRVVPGLERISTIVDVPTAIMLLGGMDEVMYVEPNFVVRPAEESNDPSFGNQWGLENFGQVIRGVTGKTDADLDMHDAWDVHTGSSSVTVAVIDSGAKLDHEDLAANIWVNTGEVPNNGIDDDGNGFIDDLVGWDFYDADADPTDLTGHGSLMAGIIGARGNNGLGITGVAWQCQMVILRVLGANGGMVSDVILAMEYCADKNVRFSNQSFGGYDFSQAYLDALQALVGVHLVVAAAGNDTNDNDVNPYYPASYGTNNIIAIAATNNKDQLAFFSNFGANSVHMGAPGVSIYSTNRLGGYSWTNGTSAAAAHVTGLAVLLASQYNWDPVRIRTRILNSRRKVAALNGKTIFRSVPNAYRAMRDQTVIPAVPGTPVLTDLQNGGCLMEWADNSNNENRFLVQRQRRDGNTWVDWINVARPGRNKESMLDNPGAGTYRYRIRAVNQKGPSEWTDWVQVTITGP